MVHMVTNHDWECYVPLCPTYKNDDDDDDDDVSHFINTSKNADDDDPGMVDSWWFTHHGYQAINGPAHGFTPLRHGFGDGALGQFVLPRCLTPR